MLEQSKKKELRNLTEISMLLLKIRQDKKLSRRKASYICEVSENQIYRAETRANITIIKLTRIVAGYGLTLKQFISQIEE